MKCISINNYTNIFPHQTSVFKKLYKLSDIFRNQYKNIAFTLRLFSTKDF